jgi:hypothetical protein
MQTRKDDSINPYNHEQDDGSFIGEIGLTKREYFAGIAMQGLLSNIPDEDYHPRQISEAAVEVADFLIKVLNESRSG